MTRRLLAAALVTVAAFAPAAHAGHTLVHTACEAVEDQAPWLLACA